MAEACAKVPHALQDGATSPVEIALYAALDRMADDAGIGRAFPEDQLMRLAGIPSTRVFVAATRWLLDAGLLTLFDAPAVGFALRPEGVPVDAG